MTSNASSFVHTSRAGIGFCGALFLCLSLIYWDSFYYPFTDAKQVIYLFGLPFAAFIASPILRDLGFPEVSPPLRILGVLFACTCLYSAFFAWINPWSTLLRYASLSIYSACFYRLIAYSKDALEALSRWIAASGVLSIGIYVVQLLVPPLKLAIYPKGHPAALIGNTNMLAEFLGITLCATIYLHLLKPKFRYEGLIALNLWALYSLNCRSIYLWLLIAGSTVAIWGLACSRRALVSFARCIASAGILAVSLATIFDLMGPNLPDQSSGTAMLRRKKVSVQSTMQTRFNLWKDSLDIAAQRPFGIGVDAFEFHQTEIAKRNRRSSNSETEVFRGPHNEVLRVLVEIGFLPATILGGLFALLCWGFIVHLKFRAISPEQAFGCLLLSLFLIQGFVQFPGELALPSLGLALLFAILIRAQKTSSRLSRLRQLPHDISAAVLVVAAALGIMAGLSQLWSGSPDAKPELLRWACRIYPDNVGACLASARAQMRRGAVNDALKSLRYLEQKTEGRSQAVRLTLADAYWQQQNFEEACRRYRDYDQYFDNISSIHQEFLHKCGN